MFAIMWLRHGSEVSLRRYHICLFYKQCFPILSRDFQPQPQKLELNIIFISIQIIVPKAHLALGYWLL